jgi:hypothetical protein
MLKIFLSICFGFWFLPNRYTKSIGRNRRRAGGVDTVIGVNPLVKLGNKNLRLLSPRHARDPLVIPAKAGIQGLKVSLSFWIPAFAGMTRGLICLVFVFFQTGI